MERATKLDSIRFTWAVVTWVFHVKTYVPWEIIFEEFRNLMIGKDIKMYLIVTSGIRYMGKQPSNKVVRNSKGTSCHT